MNLPIETHEIIDNIDKNKEICNEELMRENDHKINNDEKAFFQKKTRENDQINSKHNISYEAINENIETTEKNDEKPEKNEKELKNLLKTLEKIKVVKFPLIPLKKHTFLKKKTMKASEKNMLFERIIIQETKTSDIIQITKKIPINLKFAPEELERKSHPYMLKILKKDSVKARSESPEMRIKFPMINNHKKENLIQSRNSLKNDNSFVEIKENTSSISKYDKSKENMKKNEEENTINKKELFESKENQNNSIAKLSPIKGIQINTEEFEKKNRGLKVFIEGKMPKESRKRLKLGFTRNYNRIIPIIRRKSNYFYLNSKKSSITKKDLISKKNSISSKNSISKKI